MSAHEVLVNTALLFFKVSLDIALNTDELQETLKSNQAAELLVSSNSGLPKMFDQVRIARVLER